MTDYLKRAMYDRLFGSFNWGMHASCTPHGSADKPLSHTEFFTQSLTVVD